MKSVKVDKNVPIKNVQEDTPGTVDTSPEMVNANLAQAVLTATQKRTTIPKLKNLKRK